MNLNRLPSGSFHAAPHLHRVGAILARGVALAACLVGILPACAPQCSERPETPEEEVGDPPDSGTRTPTKRDMDTGASVGMDASPSSTDPQSGGKADAPSGDALVGQGDSAPGVSIDMNGDQPLPEGVLYATDFSKSLGAVLPADPNWPLCDGALCAKKGDATIFFTNGADWKDYAVEISAWCSVGGPTVFFRSQNASRTYGVEVKWDGGSWGWIIWRIDGKYSALKSGRLSTDKAYLSQKWFRVRVQVKGAQISVALKRDVNAGQWEELGAATDATFTKGGIGLKMHAYNMGKFDDLLVRALP